MFSLPFEAEKAVPRKVSQGRAQIPRMVPESPTLATAEPRLTGFEQGLEDKAVDAGEGS